MKALSISIALAAIAMLFASCTMIGANEPTPEAQPVEVIPGPPGPEGPTGERGPVGPQGSIGDPGLDWTAPEYVGSEACGECHEEIYASYMETGHPYIQQPVVNGEAPKFPETEVPDPPEGMTWDDILYVVGGYAWKALFVDQQGNIITGDEGATTQFNLENKNLEMDGGWVAYHAGENLQYDCAVCHSTGYVPEGHQNDVPGLVGMWAENGVGCERCHGAGSNHVNNPYQVSMVVDRNSELCGECHTMVNPDITDASEGFYVHRGQYPEMYVSTKRVMECVDCHNPHLSTVYGDSTEDRALCAECHFEQERYKKITDRRHASCVGCHVPTATVFAMSNPDLHSGDMHTHLFGIDPQAQTKFEENGTTEMPYLTVDFSCKGCHNADSRGGELSDEELMDAATGYHDRDQSGSLNKR